jgi:hypothetical protein
MMMIRRRLASISLTTAIIAAFAAATAGDFTFHRPSETSWKRTRCGSPKGTADIPSQWASFVSATSSPLPAHPRPQMVRLAAAGANNSSNTLNNRKKHKQEDLAALRDHHDTATASVWTNLNGL